MFVPFCVGFATTKRISQTKKGSDKRMTEVFLLMTYMGFFSLILMLGNIICAVIRYVTHKRKGGSR